MEKKIYEKPCSEVVDYEPLGCLLGVSIPKGEGTPPGTAEAPALQIFTDIDPEEEVETVDTWGVNWDD